MRYLPVRHLNVVCCLLLVAGCLCGCSGGEGRPGPEDGKARGTVTGKVTNGSKPVSPATILFDNSSQGISRSVEIKADGTFEVRTYKEAGLPVGTYKVAITPGSMKPLEDAPL